jgi:CRISPR type I-E-associated protein CasB/Cse2
MNSSDHAIKFVKYLESLKENSKIMAELRRCRHSENLFECGKYIYNFLPHDRMTWQTRCYIVVASLYATHQGNTNTPFGECLSQTALSDRRMIRFLRSENEGLFLNLRQIIHMARNVDINWSQLLTGLCNWNHKDKWVQNEFAQCFWKNRTKEEENEEPKDDEDESESEE